MSAQGMEMLHAGNPKHVPDCRSVVPRLALQLRHDDFPLLAGTRSEASTQELPDVISGSDCEPSPTDQHYFWKSVPVFCIKLACESKHGESRGNDIENDRIAMIEGALNRLARNRRARRSSAGTLPSLKHPSTGLTRRSKAAFDKVVVWRHKVQGRSGPSRSRRLLAHVGSARKRLLSVFGQ